MKKLCVNEIMNAPAIIRRSVTTTLVVNAILDSIISNQYPRFHVPSLNQHHEGIKIEFQLRHKILFASK